MILFFAEKNHMKTILILFIVLIAFSHQEMANAQTGINTSTPKATLDVKGKGSIITVADGIIAPTLTKQQLASKTLETYTDLQTGALVFINDIGIPIGTIPSMAQVAQITAVGYYYFDGTLWQKMGITADKSIYTNDGTLAGNRIVTQGPSTLAFNAAVTNAFSVDGTTFSVDAANHRVGVGTVTPQKPLHVNANSDAVRFESLAPLPANTSATGLVINTNGDIYKNNTTSVEGQIIRLGLNGGTYQINEAALRFNVNGSATGMGNAPNGAPNFINTILGATITNNVSVIAGKGSPARMTDQITLQPGVYKVQVRLTGNFGGSASTNNSIFLKCIVSNNEYSLVDLANTSNQNTTYLFDDYINITGSAQTVDFTISPNTNSFTTLSSATPGVGSSYRSLILIQRLR